MEQHQNLLKASNNQKSVDLFTMFPV